MKTLLLIVFFALSLVFLSSCINQSHQEQPLIIPAQSQQEEINQLRLENENLKKQNTQLNSELEKYKLTLLANPIDLSQWTEDDIIRAFETLNPKFKSVSWFEYRYDSVEAYYYDLEGPIFQDPFYKLSYDRENREWTVDFLRIFDLGYDDLGLALQRFSEYREKILKEMRIDKELNCYEQSDCREIKLISCKKGKDDFYVWFAKRYLFTSRNDSGDAYRTFKKLYCETPGTQTITSLVIKDTGKPFSLFEFLAGLFK